MTATHIAYTAIISTFRNIFKIFRGKESDKLLTYERYAEFRDAKGMTDYKISRLAGIPPSTFSDWKSGRYTPKLETQMKIANILKLSPRELVSRDDIKRIGGANE